MSKLLWLLAIAPGFPKDVEGDESKIFGNVFELPGDSMKEPESSAPCSAVFYRTFLQLPTVGAQLDTTHYTPHLLETYFLSRNS